MGWTIPVIGKISWGLDKTQYLSYVWPFGSLLRSWKNVYDKTDSLLFASDGGFQDIQNEIYSSTVYDIALPRKLKP